MARKGIGLVCDTAGKIIRVIYDSLGIESLLASDSNLGVLFNRKSRSEFEAFLRETATSGASFGVELFCNNRQEHLGLRLNGLAAGEGIIVIATEARPESEYDKLFDEIAALNNELVNARRELAKKNADLDRLASTDSLTGMPNRRVILEYGQEYFRLAKRYGLVFALVMADFDHFKMVNDTYGHQAGDEVLKRTGDIIARSLRDTDHFGRYGGEEIIILLPNTHADQALSAAERIRADIAGETFTNPDGDIFSVTVSLGIAVFDNEESLEALVEKADKALYRAKESGRNQVRL